MHVHIKLHIERIFMTWEKGFMETDWMLPTLSRIHVYITITNYDGTFIFRS